MIGLIRGLLRKVWTRIGARNAQKIEVRFEDIKREAENEHENDEKEQGSWEKCQLKRGYGKYVITWWVRGIKTVIETKPSFNIAVWAFHYTMYKWPTILCAAIYDSSLLQYFMTSFCCLTM